MSIQDPKSWSPGDRLQYIATGDIATIGHRKADDSGWWLADGKGGLVDSAAADDAAWKNLGAHAAVSTVDELLAAIEAAPVPKGRTTTAIIGSFWEPDGTAVRSVSIRWDKWDYIETEAPTLLEALTGAWDQLQFRVEHERANR